MATEKLKYVLIVERKFFASKITSGQRTQQMTKRRSSVLIVQKDLLMIIYTRSIESVFMRRPTHSAADMKIARQSTMIQATETAMREKNMEQFMNKRIGTCACICINYL